LNAFIDVLFFSFVIITELSQTIRLGHQDEINDARLDRDQPTGIHLVYGPRRWHNHAENILHPV